MPMAPPRACPRCGRLRCLEHQWSGWSQRRADVTPRVRGRELQRRRVRLFQREPWCRLCAQAGRRTLATIRDHVRPLAEGGPDDETNEQPLCHACSDRKTAAESLRGRGRGPDNR